MNKARHFQLVHSWTVTSTSELNMNSPLRRHGQGHVTHWRPGTQKYGTSAIANSPIYSVSLFIAPIHFGQRSRSKVPKSFFRGNFTACSCIYFKYA